MKTVLQFAETQLPSLFSKGISLNILKLFFFFLVSLCRFAQGKFLDRKAYEKSDGPTIFIAVLCKKHRDSVSDSGKINATADIE